MRQSSGQWARNGKAATDRDLAESAKLARAHRRKLTAAEHAARQSDAQARRVGAAIRRAAREQQVRYMTWLTVKPKRESGRSKGRVRCRRFEAMTGLTFSKASHRGTDGLSSFHFQWRSRGLRPRKGQKNSHRYRRGEAARLVRYIMRELAREIEGGGIVSSISLDPDDIATAFGAVEELEVAAGQENGNVYVSIVISLPHELSATGRERALARIGETFEEESLPFAGVLHKPDPGTDPRNFHAHIIASLRPFRKEADGRLSFAALPSSDLNDELWIAPLRERIAKAINEEMAVLQAETGVRQRLFTHLSNKDRGLAPRNKTDGKDGPGVKARDRKAQDAELARREAAMHRDRYAALNDLVDVVKSVAERVPLDISSILASAREAVAGRARSLAAAAAQAQERARRRWYLRWVTEFHASRMDDGQLTSRKENGFLSDVPFLQQASSPSSTPTLQSRGKVNGVVFGQVPKQQKSTNAITHEPAPTPGGSTPVQAPDKQATVVPMPATMPADIAGHQGSRSEAQSADERRERAINRVLAELAAMPFLPLKTRPADNSYGSSYEIKHADAAKDIAIVLRQAQALQGNYRIQALCAEKFDAMVEEVFADLTRRKVKPSGNVVDLFAGKPLLQAAVRAGWSNPKLKAKLDEARDFWTKREADLALTEIEMLRGLAGKGTGRS